MKLFNIPRVLWDLPQWVCCNKDKVPKDPKNGRNAKTNDPSTWGTLPQAARACLKKGYEHVGFVFTINDEYFGVDLDKCVGDDEFCDEFADTLKTYCEYSRSGKGLHLICKGVLPEGGRRHDGVEMYSEGRYFIFTGNIYNPKYTEIVDCTESIKPLHQKYIPSRFQNASDNNSICIANDLSDEDLKEMARSSRYGVYFSLLYSGSWGFCCKSQSEADFNLCRILAFWTGRNALVIDRIFRSSGLMRPKWDEKRGNKTYGEITIEKAMKSCTSVYVPFNKKGS